ncbi:MAG: sigma-70 family RNA polymerase sigma factor, partial [Chloroflexi bacterium]
MPSLRTRFPVMLYAYSKSLTFSVFMMKRRRRTNMLYEAVVASRSDTCEAILRRLDGYIISQVHRLGRCYSRDIHPAVLDLELDEIIQRVRIKLWQALEKRDIRYPYAYIKLIIQSEFIDMKRRQKPYLSVSIDEGLTHAEVEIATRHMADPAETVAQQMDASTCLKEMIQAVLALPPRQQNAMICSLKERVDDLRQLIEAFKVYKMDI